MLCSFFIPSRKRPEGLLKAIDSIYATAAPEHFEILVRLDDDDEATLALQSKLATYDRVRVIIGSHLKGYESVGVFILELAALATAPWCCMIDDDVTLHGDWHSSLKHLPLDGFHVTAGRYCIGKRDEKGEGSCYESLGRVQAWFVPTHVMKWFNSPPAGGVDAALHDMLVRVHGWKPVLLPGVTYQHDWQRPKEEAAARMFNDITNRPSANCPGCGTTVALS